MKNISNYLNEYRLISDAVDILDARVYNYAVDYEIVVRRGVDRTQVLSLSTHRNTALQVVQQTVKVLMRH